MYKKVDRFTFIFYKHFVSFQETYIYPHGDLNMVYGKSTNHWKHNQFQIFTRIPKGFVTANWLD